MMLPEFLEENANLLGLKKIIIRINNIVENTSKEFNITNLNAVKNDFKDYVFENAYRDDNTTIIEVHKINYGLCVGDIVKITGKNFIIDKIEDEFAFIKLENNFYVSISCRNLCKYKINPCTENKITSYHPYIKYIQEECPSATEHVDITINGEVNELYFVCVDLNNKYVFANDIIEVHIDKDTYKKYKGCEYDV